ncbi:carboxylesterase [Thalassobacillus sp. CUG 92003]|uniref:alpha/beta hydrolase n=1 Tax=Thalassobacillus sp. CUG 92003 TaxID=2736641 RepID=UPI0015E751EE|nr:alpha/beta fold hydrolase [Thalassobacillus sp. CUG 92003]
MKVGCLCIHGYTGSPHEIEPLVEFLANRTAYEFKVPTLPGHGKGQALDLKGHYYQEWVAAAELALLNMMDKYDRIYIIGFSMGGMLGAYLAVKYSIDKLILLSAAGKYLSISQTAKDIAGMVQDAWQGTLNDNDLFSRYREKMKHAHFFSTLEFIKCVHFTRPYLGSVTCPVMIVQGELDGMVPSGSADFLQQEIPSEHKEFLLLKNSKHLICHGEDREELFDAVLAFLTTDHDEEGR